MKTGGRKEGEVRVFFLFFVLLLGSKGRERVGRGRKKEKGMRKEGKEKRERRKGGRKERR